MTSPSGGPDERDFVVLSKQLPAAGPSNTLVITVALLAAVGGAVGFVATVLGGGSTTAIGSALVVAFGGLAVAVRRGFASLYPRLEAVQHRDNPTSARADVAVVQPLRRRSFVLRAVAAAGALVVVGLLAPLSGLANRRRGVEQATRWTSGVRLVDNRDRPVRADDVPPGGLSLAWPEGLPRQELAAVIVVRLEEGQVVEPPTNPEWIVGGRVLAYSKVCTHAGCPVALYQAERSQLTCPCHLASFDVLRGATPTFGPTSRPLPQLPLGVDGDGFLVALGDFVDPVGPPVG